MIFGRPLLLPNMERGYLQHRAQLSKLDDSAVRDRREFERAAFEQAAAQRDTPGVTGTDGVVYAPDHPNADFAGFLSRDALERAHFQGKQRQSVTYTDGGVMPSYDAPTSDYRMGAGRKHYEGDLRFTSREVLPGSAPLLADPTYFKPGGQDDRFITEAMSAVI